MLKVKLEGIIDNIIILDNQLLFAMLDEDGQTVYTEVPQNKYMPYSDTYEDVQAFLFDKAYLNFNSAGALEDFKQYCINEFDSTKKDYCIIKYNGLHGIVEYEKDHHVIII